LVIEPNNKTILEELKKLPPSNDNNTKQKQPQVQKRRLPIRIVDEEYPSAQKSRSVPTKPIKTSPPPKISAQQNTKGKAEPIKTEPVKTEPVKTEPVKTEPIKAAHIKAEPVKVEPQPTENKIPINTKLPAKFKCPLTNLEFERDWKTYKVRGDDLLYQYFKVKKKSYTKHFLKKKKKKKKKKTFKN
jgi:hypothetical protein